MKWIVVALVVLLTSLQYQLWFEPDGIARMWALQKQVAQEKATNEKLRMRNKLLSADVRDLKRGNEAIEDRAREDLGMVKNDETFYQVVK